MSAWAMRSHVSRFWAMWRSADVQAAATLGLVVLGPMLVLATFLTFAALDDIQAGVFLRVVLLADLVYVLVVAALIFRRIAAMVAARRARSVGARLHLRLTGAFALLALIPTVTVAVFAVLTINIGLEGWFSERVRSVVAASLEAAETYRDEQRAALSEDAALLARFIEINAEDNPVGLHDDMRELLQLGTALLQRGLKKTFLLDEEFNIWLRGESSYLFDFVPPPTTALDRVRSGEVGLIADLDRDEYRALIRLDVALPRAGTEPKYLYVTRRVDGDLLQLLDETQATARLYQQLEGERGRRLFQFGVLYLGFALILILAAIWLGMIVAERLSRPIGRLAQAAERIGEGKFDIRVPVSRSDDEIALLGRSFNTMTAQLATQRQALLDTNAQIEARRRLFDSVLSSVTSGVLGLDPDGRIAFSNRAAMAKLGDDLAGRMLSDCAAEFSGMFGKLAHGGNSVAQGEVRMVRAGGVETLLVRMAERRGAQGTLEGYVVAFDDVSELVAAQRLAAWGDVARRIAHEIKNPLTPIQLSAERIRRKFRPSAAPEAAKLDDLTAVIVRQTEDLRRIVDEFSRFARMPRPDQSREDMGAVLRDAVTLQEAAYEGTEILLDVPEQPCFAQLDRALFGQALTNLIANAAEAIESRRATGWQGAGRVTVRLAPRADNQAVITISDNGIGLPDDPAPLLEPYVTTREKGTGLGLAIVNKIVTEQGGRFQLRPAAMDQDGHAGAAAVITMPCDGPDKNKNQNQSKSHNND